MPNNEQSSCSINFAPRTSTSASPPLDYLAAAIAEDHGATILHYDADFDRLAAHTDLSVGVEALAPLGTLP